MVIQASTAADLDIASGHLTDLEQLIAANIKSERRRDEFILGRHAAKKSLGALLGQANLSAVSIDRGPFGEPVVVGNANVGVSIAHVEGQAWASAFRISEPLGLDVESFSRFQDGCLDNAMTEREREICFQFKAKVPLPEVLLFSAKEALAKLTQNGPHHTLASLSVKSMFEGGGKTFVVRFDTYPAALVAIKVRQKFCISIGLWNRLPLAQNYGEKLLSSLGA